MNTLEHAINPGGQGKTTLDLVARSGYAAHGIVYLVVGGIAIQAGVGRGGSPTGAKGALQSLTDETFGQVLILFLAAGLLTYAFWRAVQALLDAENHGAEPTGLLTRGSLLVSSLVHFALAYYALALVFGLPGGGGEGSADFAQWLLSQPYGRYLLGLCGLSIIGAGFAQIWKGATGRFKKSLSVPHDKQQSVYPVCALGLVARGVVFTIIGSLFIYAARRVDPSQAGGTGDALDWLRDQPFGEIFFLSAAVGLILFGLYRLAEALWRRVPVVEEFE